MRFAQMAFVGLLGLALIAPVFAQPGPGMGGGMQGAGQGGGMGPGGGMGMRFNQGNTTGWSLMSADERSAHRSKMMSAKTYDECKAVQAEQHTIMEARAKEKGQTLPAPRQNGCDRMKAKGMFK